MQFTFYIILDLLSSLTCAARDDRPKDITSVTDHSSGHHVLGFLTYINGPTHVP